jgi:hypothetical protein
MRKMKRFWYALVCLLLVVVNSSNVVANLTVTSETHHAWGSVETFSGVVYDSYDYMDNNPVSGSACYKDCEDRWYAHSGTGLLVVSLLKVTGLRANVTEGLAAYYPFSDNTVDETGNN